MLLPRPEPGRAQGTLAAVMRPGCGAVLLCLLISWGPQSPCAVRDDGGEPRDEELDAAAAAERAKALDARGEARYEAGKHAEATVLARRTLALPEKASARITSTWPRASQASPRCSSCRRSS